MALNNGWLVSFSIPADLAPVKINRILSVCTSALASALLLTAVPQNRAADPAVAGRGPNAKGTDASISGEESVGLNRDASDVVKAVEQPLNAKKK